MNNSQIDSAILSAVGEHWTKVAMVQELVNLGGLLFVGAAEAAQISFELNVLGMGITNVKRTGSSALPARHE